MDLQRLKERYPILVSYMENQHYSWQYIKHVKNEARWILRESENYGWKTYDDVYQTCVKKYSNKYTLLYKRKIIYYLMAYYMCIKHRIMIICVMNTNALSMCIGML